MYNSAAFYGFLNNIDGVYRGAIVDAMTDDMYNSLMQAFQKFGWSASNAISEKHIVMLQEIQGALEDYYAQNQARLSPQSWGNPEGDIFIKMAVEWESQRHDAHEEQFIQDFENDWHDYMDQQSDIEPKIQEYLKIVNVKGRAQFQIPSGKLGAGRFVSASQGAALGYSIDMDMLADMGLSL